MSIALNLKDEPRDTYIRDTIARVCPCAESVLDVGCGLSLQSRYIDADRRVGLDIYKPFLDKIETDVPYTAVNADALDIDKFYAPESFDVVLVLDMIEHLDKDTGYRLLEIVEQVAKRLVYITTPRGFTPQNIDLWECNGHEYQTHRSGWFPEEFTERGYWVTERGYTMRDIKRHDLWRVEPDVRVINAMLLKP